jgi:hypothetical protein
VSAENTTPPEPEGTAETTEAPTVRLEEQESQGQPAAQLATEPRIPRPRIRWGAIVWGLIVAMVAVATLAITRTAESREDFALWLTQLGPAGLWLIAVLAAGGILLLLGLLAAIRRAQGPREHVQR